MAQPHIARATLNYYLDPAKGGHKEFYFGTIGEKRRPFEQVEVSIRDIRGQEQDFKLDIHGFQYVKASSRLTPEDTNSHERIREVYYQECVDLLKRITGASRVHIMGHICRKQNWDTLSETMKDQNDMDRTPNPTSARYVHVDYSYAGARNRLNFYLKSEASTLSESRWAIINLWRPIFPITRENLALLDARSIHDEELRPVVAKFRRPDAADEKLPEIIRAAYNRNDVETWSVAPPVDPEQHKWYYCSKLDPDEALLIKIFDSAGEEGVGVDVARRTPHTAFTCEEDYGEQRQSIEVRSLVFWE